MPTNQYSAQVKRISPGTDLEIPDDVFCRVGSRSQVFRTPDKDISTISTDQDVITSKNVGVMDRISSIRTPCYPVNIGRREMIACRTTILCITIEHVMAQQVD